MEVTYFWTILEMQEYPHQDGLTDVVFSVTYGRNATTNVDGNTYSVISTGQYKCPTPSPSSFIPYEELTQDIVISWLNAGVDYESIDANLLVRLEKQINPPVVSLPLPWITTSTTTTTTTNSI